MLIKVIFVIIVLIALFLWYIGQHMTNYFNQKLKDMNAGLPDIKNYKED